MEVAASIVIPTVGRRDLLDACLRSLLSCQPRADDIVVVDQSHGRAVDELVNGLESTPVRRVECDGTGVARATNRGIAAAKHDTVFITHDDCTVADDWIAVGWHLAQTFPQAIITGRVMPAAGAGYVPSTKTDPDPHDYTGQLTSGVLYPANMISSRRALESIGCFDERQSFLLAAEDNDLCYRWLDAGRALRYEPDLVVWHHDWRAPEQVVQTHIGYARAQGAFYAKHLYAGDFRVLPMVAWDLRRGFRTTLRGRLRGEPRWEDSYREMLHWMPVGLIDGFCEARRLKRAHRGEDVSRE